MSVVDNLGLPERLYVEINSKIHYEIKDEELDALSIAVFDSVGQAQYNYHKSKLSDYCTQLGGAPKWIYSMIDSLISSDFSYEGKTYESIIR